MDGVASSQLNFVSPRKSGPEIQIWESSVYMRI